MHERFSTTEILMLNPAAGIEICIYPVALVGDEVNAAKRISSADAFRLSQIKHPQKQKEFLASRLALVTLDANYLLTYQGRIPYMDSGRHVSLSHAHHIAAAILSTDFRVGIDVEMEREQLFKISHKFLHPEERALVRSGRELQDLHIIWGAKEALFKIWRMGNVDFSHELRISAFEAAKNGQTKAHIIKDGLVIPCTVHYHQIGQYYLIYAWAGQ